MEPMAKGRRRRRRRLRCQKCLRLLSNARNRWPRPQRPPNFSSATKNFPSNRRTKFESNRNSQIRRLKIIQTLQILKIIQICQFSTCRKRSSRRKDRRSAAAPAPAAQRKNYGSTDRTPSLGPKEIHMEILENLRRVRIRITIRANFQRWTRRNVNLSKNG